MSTKTKKGNKGNLLANNNNYDECPFEDFMQVAS